jgi:flagellar biosynthesis chaperone FliJ
LVDPTRIAGPTPVPELSWFNDQLDGGKRTAVTRALGSPEFFLLEGPPGTGKTAFITELVRQELQRKPDARILLVSQTHVAVDNALVRLAEAGVPELVRLGKAENERIAEQVHQHLLDQRMPVWVRGIRERGEEHLAQLAAADDVDLAHCYGTAALIELAAAIDDRDAARTKLNELTGPRNRAKTQQGTSDAEAASEAGALNDRLQLLATRIADLRNRAHQQLGVEPLNGLPTSDDELTATAVRAVVKTVVDADPKLRKLVGILTLQAEWFQRIESSKDLEAVLLRQARVVAGTCLGFMAHPAVRELEFDLCILDEASKATATETLVPLSRSKRWVLVGDPNQLPPMQEEVLDRPDLMTRHGLERSDVERSLFQDLLDQTPETTRQQLTEQYRMHPAIGDLVSKCFYHDKLRSATSSDLAGWDTLYAPVTWLDTGRSRNRRERRSGTTVSNHHEVQVIKKALLGVQRAVKAGMVRTEDGGPLRVLVLTAYRRQMDELQNALAGQRSTQIEIEVNTVDAVQGREADVTFYSVVRSNDSGSLGFLGGPYWRRVNVALSRSRFGLVIVGDAPFCEKTTGPLQKVLTHMRKHPDHCRVEEAGA